MNTFSNIKNLAMLEQKMARHVSIKYWIHNFLSKMIKR